MSHPIVLDIETQHTFQEVGQDLRKLKISVVGTFDYGTNEYRAYFEDELPKLFTRLEHASFLIGFNINKFDLLVLSPYYLGNVSQFATLDLLEEVEKALGFRLALDDLARATLKTKKSGHGFLAIDYYKKRQWGKLKKYCLDDVRITKELYEFGKINRKLFFLGRGGLATIPVSFDGKSLKSKTVSLSLPF